MFTGLIETTGQVTQLRSVPEGKIIQIKVAKLAEELHVGESIAIDGACLSVTTTGTDKFTVLAVQETLRRTTFGTLKVGEIVNLERAMSGNARFEGHLVQGHVDCTARIVALERSGKAARLAIEIPAVYQHLTVEKGSLAINGISLTIATKQQHWLSVALIPLTLANTNLGLKKVGDLVNVEFDILAKYIANFMQDHSALNDWETIATKWGFDRK